MRSKKLQQWFDQKNKVSRHFVSLLEGILHSRGWRYLIYRLRYFAAIVLIRSILQILEFAAIYYYIGVNTLISVAVIRGISYAISAGYWGFLEVLRTKIRDYCRCQQKSQVPAVVRHWLWLSLLIGLVVSLGYFSVLWFLSQPSSAYPLFFKIYSVCLFVQLVLQLLILTFHASVYALRRIVRPSASIYSVHIMGFVLLVLLWPVLHIYSLPASQLMARLTSFFLSYYFTKRSYSMLSLDQYKTKKRQSWRRSLKGVLSAEAVLASLASLIMRGEGVVVLMLFIWSLHDQSSHHAVFLFFFLIAPLMKYSFSWARLFYFDFKRLEYFPLGPLSRVFLTKLARYSFIIGVLFWCLSSLILYFYRGDLVYLSALLLPIFLLRAPIAILQVHAFCMRRYLDVILSGLLTLGSILIVANTALPIYDLMLLLTFMMTLSLVYLCFVRTSIINHQSEFYFPVNFYEWLSLYRDHKQSSSSMQVYSIVFDRQLRDSDLNKLSKKVALILADQGRVARLTRFRCVLFLSQAALERLDRIKINCAGCINQLELFDFELYFQQQTLTQKGDLSVVAKRLFPGLVVYNIEQPICTNPVVDFSTLQISLLRLMQSPYKAISTDDYVVSIGVDGSGIRNYFLIPLSEFDDEKSQCWRQTVVYQNYLAIMDPLKLTSRVVASASS